MIKVQLLLLKEKLGSTLNLQIKLLAFKNQARDMIYGLLIQHMTQIHLTDVAMMKWQKS